MLKFWYLHILLVDQKQLFKSNYQDFLRPKTQKSTGKVMDSDFGDACGTTILCQYYVGFLEGLKAEIAKKRPHIMAHTVSQIVGYDDQITRMTLRIVSPFTVIARFDPYSQTSKKVLGKEIWLQCRSRWFY